MRKILYFEVFTSMKYCSILHRRVRVMKLLGLNIFHEKLKYISKAGTNKINVFKMGNLEDRMEYS